MRKKLPFLMSLKDRIFILSRKPYPEINSYPQISSNPFFSLSRTAYPPAITTSSSSSANNNDSPETFEACTPNHIPKTEPELPRTKSLPNGNEAKHVDDNANEEDISEARPIIPTYAHSSSSSSDEGEAVDDNHPELS